MITQKIYNPSKEILEKSNITESEFQNLYEESINNPEEFWAAQADSYLDWETKWDQVHEIAEQLEHISSQELVNRLDNYLGNPGFDPHGDPIPNKNGEFPKSFSSPLVSLELNQQGQVVGVSQDTPSFLQYLDKLKIQLGSHIKVVDKIEFDQSLEVLIQNKTVQISAAVAKNILIKIK